MKIYVSDLDGTLLNSNQQVSDKSKDILNKLIDKGIKFTVATARTPATVVPILHDIHINIPAVMMNGVLLYDIQKQKFLDVKSINDSTASKVLEVFKSENKDFFVYAIKDNKLVVYYRNLNKYEKEYYKERCNRPLKTFIYVEEYGKNILDSDIINFVVLDKYEKLKPIEDKLKKIEGITTNLYKDPYGDGNYFMDIYNSSASKANGLKTLSEEYFKGEQVIAFGDNINDIPMFKEADECYAVENAAEELKSLATGVIGNHNNDSVAEFIEKDALKEIK